MSWLQLSLEVHDVLVEERLCRVGPELWLGDHPRAVISFPAGPVRVHPSGRGVSFDGRLLAPGRSMVWRHGPYVLRAEVAELQRNPRLVPDLPDPRLLVATVAVILLGNWVDSVRQVATAHPEAVQRVQAMIRPSLRDVPPPLGPSDVDTGAPMASDALELPPNRSTEWLPAVRFAPEPQRRPVRED